MNILIVFGNRNMLKKFDDDSVGQIFTTKIDEIEDDGIGIRINYTIDGTLYRTNMTYSKYVEERKAVVCGSG